MVLIAEDGDSCSVFSQTSLSGPLSLQARAMEPADATPIT